MTSSPAALRAVQRVASGGDRWPDPEPLATSEVEGNTAFKRFIFVKRDVRHLLSWHSCYHYRVLAAGLSALPLSLVFFAHGLPMITLSEAIEFNDRHALESIFETAGLSPPMIKWDPKPEDIEIEELRFLLNYWQGQRQDSKIPNLSKIDALDLTPCLGYLMVLDIGQDELTYRVYGTKIARASGFDLTGKTVSSITSHSFIPTFFNACYRATQRRQIPILTQHEPPVEISVYSWTRLILPLANDAGEIVRFLAGNFPGKFKHDRPATSLF